MGPPVVERHGWRVTVVDGSAQLEAILAVVDDGSAPSLRRSRHATTFRIAGGESRGGVYVKVFKPAVGLSRLKSLFRRSRSSYLAQIMTALAAAGIAVPQIICFGRDRRSGREILVTAAVEGDGPLAAIARLQGKVEAKRALLRHLGNEVARLHRMGFVHGELTPFNIRFGRGEPPKVTFLDNDRTAKCIIGDYRLRLRNLAQLGCFELPGITRTDRLRVFRAYEAALYQSRSDDRLRRVSATIDRRMGRHPSQLVKT